MKLGKIKKLNGEYYKAVPGGCDNCVANNNEEFCSFITYELSDCDHGAFNKIDKSELISKIVAKELNKQKDKLDQVVELLGINNIDSAIDNLIK